MKKAVIVICIAVIAASIFMFKEESFKSEEYLRIHIRANSNSSEDQSVKYEIKDQIVSYLTPYLVKAVDKEKAIEIVKGRMSALIKIADKVLQEKGFDYSSRAEVRKEEFPTRAYGDLVLESGEYDALIIELGSGTGDNWWCAVYPPLCFLPSDGENYEYRSKIYEIIRKFKESTQDKEEEK